MGDENHIPTLGDYSKPRHKGYMNYIKVPVGNNVAPIPSSTHNPKAYVEAVNSNSHPQNQNEPPKMNPFAFHERTGSNPQPQELETTFEARVPDYMAAHTERIEIFENVILKQREEINGSITEIMELVKKAETKNGAENEAKNKPIKKPEKEEVVEAPNSRPVEYYLKHRINEKLIEGLVYNKMFNDSLIGGLKNVNALVDQRSDVNVMPYSTYMKLIDERPGETNIILLLACHSYIYPLGIAEDVLVKIAKHVYHMDLVILDIKKDKNRPFILGTPFLTTAKAVIKFDKGTITLRSGKVIFDEKKLGSS
uniref:Reverse transcriptase domain-containing protein n=1 Tax=Tanacetum cinerariifolium TaxID=118510 RepID=A0A6L2P150_TANCI|nr:hypothetical protein [Tanacetum cinerariifolium]